MDRSRHLDADGDPVDLVGEFRVGRGMRAQIDFHAISLADPGDADADHRGLAREDGLGPLLRRTSLVEPEALISFASAITFNSDTIRGFLVIERSPYDRFRVRSSGDG